MYNSLATANQCSKNWGAAHYSINSRVACNAMKSPLLIAFLFLTLISCNDTTSKKSAVEPKDTSTRPVTDESLFGYEISWLDSSNVTYQVDTFLTHKGKGFLCDSAIAIDYTGFFGEHTYMPLNDKGQWINIIEKRKKLKDDQLQLIHSVFGDKKSFDNPMMCKS